VNSKNPCCSAFVRSRDSARSTAGYTSLADRYSGGTSSPITRHPAPAASSGSTTAGSPGGDASAPATTSTASSVTGDVIARSAFASASIVVASRSALAVWIRKQPVVLSPAHSSSTRHAPHASIRVSTTPRTSPTSAGWRAGSADAVRCDAWVRTRSAVPGSGRSTGLRYTHRNGSGRSIWSRPPPSSVRRTGLPAASRTRTMSTSSVALAAASSSSSIIAATRRARGGSRRSRRRAPRGVGRRRPRSTRP
jgi:hypothetical protein